MSDELDDLKRAFDAATPAPDPARKAENLRLAEENFAKVQGSRSGTRQNVHLGLSGRLLNGGRKMMDAMTSKAGLTATTAIVAVGLVMVTPVAGILTDGFDEFRQRETQPEFDMTGFRITQEKVERYVASGGDSLSEGALRPTEPEFNARADSPDEAQRMEGIVVEEAPARSVKPRDDVGPIDSLRLSEVLGDESPVEDFSRRTVRVRRGDGTEREFTLDRARPTLSSPKTQQVSPSEAFTADAAEPSGTVLQEMEGAAIGTITPGRESQVVDPPVVAPESDTEAFANAAESPLKVTAEEPVSTFSIDVDTAAYAVVRSSLTAGVLPPRGAVRVEEMVNYFPYAYPAPDGEAPFRPTITVTDTPWNAGTQIVHIGIQGAMPAVADRPPLNLVFLIDTSGSMQDANKLPLLKQSFRMMLAELRPDDEVSIVTYAGSAGQVLEPTRAAERSVILDALDRLQAGGSTAGQAGLQQAYQVAEGMAGDGEVTRVILATDGDFNVGLSDPEALKDYIEDKRESGTYLSVLGFGRGNLDDATMQALAQNGNGTAAYIDTLSEARKVLVDQLTGALFPIANDVKIQVEFNPAEVAEYRLIGYETRALAREDFNNDRVDAGDIGAGHSVTALYEITPVGSDAVRNGPLRYAEAEEVADGSGELGFFKLRYKEPGEAQSILIEEPIMPGMGEAGDDMRFSLAIAGFGQLLRDGDYLGAWGWADAIALANSAKGEDPFGYRAEAVTLMRLAETLDR